MSWIEIGLVFVIALPVVVLLGMIFWPSPPHGDRTVDEVRARIAREDAERDRPSGTGRGERNL